MKSVFTNKNEVPNLEILRVAIGTTFGSWQKLRDLAKLKNPTSTEEWKFSGEKFGWSFRVSDSKRVLIYLLPRDGYFKAAFVFGPKAFEKILASDISDFIKSELVAAKPYAEGRGIRIDVKDDAILKDIEQLLSIKIGN